MTKRGTTSVPPIKPVLAMSTIRPSISTLVSRISWRSMPAPSRLRFGPMPNHSLKNSQTSRERTLKIVVSR